MNPLLACSFMSCLPRSDSRSHVCHICNHCSTWDTVCQLTGCLENDKACILFKCVSSYMSLPAVQLVNFGEDAQSVDVEMLGLQSSPETMTLTVLNSTHALDENSFDDPFKASICCLALQFACCCPAPLGQDDRCKAAQYIPIASVTIVLRAATRFSDHLSHLHV